MQIDCFKIGNREPLILGKDKLSEIGRLNIIC